MSDRWRHPLFRGLAPALALLLPVLAGWLFLDQREQALERLRADTAGISSKQESRTTAVPLPQEQLDAILADMDTPETLPDRLRQLHDVARQQGVAINKAAYRLEWDRVHGSVVGRYEMQAEMDGPYPNLRKFFRALLVVDPRLSLESIELRRPVPGSMSVRASIRLVMFVREPS